MITPATLSPLSCRPDRSRGRLHDEPESAVRSPFQRDRDRIIHARAFRRLMYKTQVFVNHEGDHYRTRLTHSLEVAQITRSVCRVLGLNEDLGEAVALAHDLGHPPFGHAGEDGLAQAMADFGGFNHNVQTLRVLTRLERRYAGFDGLNPCWETLEGVIKHNGPLLATGGGVKADGARAALPSTVRELDAAFDLGLDQWPSAEAQIAALADDVAYINHDLDDGLRAGLLDLEEVARLPVIGDAFAEVRARHDGLEAHRLVPEVTRRVIDRMVRDLIDETKARLSTLDPDGGADAVRAAGKPMVAFSAQMEKNKQAIKEYLFANFYRHYKVNRMASKARRLVRDLFGLFVEEPDCLPTDWRRAAEEAEGQRTARVVADYIAGMTDRHALAEYDNLFNMRART